ncbi:hypothetical protein SAMN05443507_11664 [Alicyclobacillus tolerans]|uniref:Uncharacterized protein n=1 Tax=Alicyclobacillus tolerans TaxID=90970 RepID=A0A1M6TFQ0_9BACL|nr:hypothetical protein SAMN05443507_11664 [Alicyclobacillus montanus]
MLGSLTIMANILFSVDGCLSNFSLAKKEGVFAFLSYGIPSRINVLPD